MDKRVFGRLCLIAFILCVISTSSVHSQISVGAIKQVSVGLGNSVPAGVSGSPLISSNSLKLVFNSDASNLVATDTNNSKDIFETDMSTGVVTRVSVNTAGSQADGDSSNPAISSVATDGFYAIAFESEATNLGTFSGQTRVKNIVIRIPSLSLTEVISLGSGFEIAEGDSRAPSVAILPQPQRIRVVFESDAPNLVSNDNNSKTDIFLAELTVPAIASGTQLLSTLKMTRVSFGTNEANGDSTNPKISGDGNYIAFESNATNLVSGILVPNRQVYLYNVLTGALSVVSKDSAASVGNGNSYEASLSYTGRFISYITEAPSIVSGAGVGKAAGVVFDTLNNIITRVNSSQFGVAGDGNVSEIAISANAKSVCFSDSSANLVEGDTNSSKDVFVKDLSTGQISRVSIGEGGNQGNDNSDLPSIAGSGFNSKSGILAFRSFATNLTAAGLSSGSDVFSNNIVLPDRILSKTTKLEVPPDVQVQGKKGIFIFENFSSISNLPLMSEIKPRAKQSVIRYDVRVNKIGGKSKDNIKKIAKKNQIALKRLKPGNYTSKYRVLTVRGDKTLRATKFSPPQMFSIVNN